MLVGLHSRDQTEWENKGVLLGQTKVTQIVSFPFVTFTGAGREKEVQNLKNINDSMFH